MEKENISGKFNWRLFLAGFCVFFSLAGYAQSPTDSTTQNKGINYVKLEIRMHILDCPVLPAQLKEKLMTVKGIRNYSIDRNYETIQFNIPEGAITKEGIEKVAASCGFPVNSVNVLIADKPFSN